MTKKREFNRSEALRAALVKLGDSPPEKKIPSGDVRAFMVKTYPDQQKAIEKIDDSTWSYHVSQARKQLRRGAGSPEGEGNTAKTVRRAKPWKAADNVGDVGNVAAVNEIPKIVMALPESIRPTVIAAMLQAARDVIAREREGLEIAEAFMDGMAKGG